MVDRHDDDDDDDAIDLSNLHTFEHFVIDEEESKSTKNEEVVVEEAIEFVDESDEESDNFPIPTA